MAKSARASSENLFSISAASEILRRTITHALQGVPADAIRSGLKLWAMQKIVDAVNSSAQAPILETVVRGSQVLTGLAAQTAIAFDAYHRAQEKMEGLKSVEARRWMARDEIGPLCREALSLMRQRDTEAGLHEEHVMLRFDSLYRLMVRSVEGPCKWSSVEGWAALDPVDEDDEEAA